MGKSSAASTAAIIGYMLSQKERFGRRQWVLAPGVKCILRALRSVSHWGEMASCLKLRIAERLGAKSRRPNAWHILIAPTTIAGFAVMIGFIELSSVMLLREGE